MKMEMKQVALIVLMGIIAGLAGAWLFEVLDSDSKEELIKNYYETENAVIVSPHSLRKMMTLGEDNFILVDLRSEEEYNISHIAGAINIPAYKDKDNSDYGAVERIVSSFENLPNGRDIIIYCYSKPCMTGRKVGKILAERGVYVKHLGIGWNEWKYDWTGWNHEHEWNITGVEDYIISGPEPGSASGVNKSAVCPIGGSVGC
ncbi:MAG TPA: rhodanese-like domain-containing protein [Candidatus Nanoarchaeia archaeon]|nr:rhodanese-like domain-containing protein [Candidatus Nanoarchaeia archaeon]